MQGYLLLEGGAEFGGQMSEPDRRAIELAGGRDSSICIIPTAAAPDNNHQRAGRKRQVVEGLGLLPNTCVLPHHDTFGKNWAQQLASLLPGVVLLGIDERTGMIDDGQEGRKMGWRVYGQGAITLYRKGQHRVYQVGESFGDNFLH